MMKSLMNCALALALIVFAGPVSVPAAAATKAEMRTEVRFFYDELSPYGRWVDHRIYGIVWVPDSGVPDWHPYSHGRWVWTADYGWYWESDEPFGWATYHYGRWTLTSDYGWVWVPDDVWGPGWADWRYSEGHVGWAPMPPEWKWRNGAVVTARVDLGQPEYEGRWIFVADSDFAAGDTRTRADAGAQLRASTRVTKIATVKGRVYSSGIDVVKLRAATGLGIPAMKVKVTQDLDARAGARTDSIVTIFKPRIAVPAELDLEADIPTHLDTRSVDTHSGAGAAVRPSDPVRPSAAENEIDAAAGVDAGVSARGRLDPSPGPNIGIGGGLGGGGLGVGGGGGLRIGR